MSAEHWQVVAQRESARADAADASRRRAEDHARTCDEQVAEARAAQHDAERQLVATVATVARMRLRMGEVEHAIMEVGRFGDRHLGSAQLPFHGVVIRRLGNGWWRAATTSAMVVGADLTSGVAHARDPWTALLALPEAVVEAERRATARADVDDADPDVRRG